MLNRGFRVVIGLCLIEASVWADTGGQSIEGTTVTANCQTYGTQIDWYPRSQAFELAEKQGKLVCLLHLSGNFSKADFT